MLFGLRSSGLNAASRFPVRPSLIRAMISSCRQGLTPPRPGSHRCRDPAEPVAAGSCRRLRQAIPACRRPPPAHLLLQSRRFAPASAAACHRRRDAAAHRPSIMPPFCDMPPRLAPPMLFHHVGHLPVLLQQAVDVFDPDAGARRDALLARGLENIGVAPLLRRHRQDDRALALDDAVVEIGGGDLVLHLAPCRATCP